MGDRLDTPYTHLLLFQLHWPNVHGPQRMKPTDFGDPLNFSMRFTFVVWNKMCQQILDGLT